MNQKVEIMPSVQNSFFISISVSYFSQISPIFARNFNLCRGSEMSFKDLTEGLMSAFLRVISMDLFIYLYWFH